MKQSDLDRGYSDTGAIPESGDNVMTADDDVVEEKRQEANERKMMEDCGYPVEEDVGGFLERRNIDDRI